MTTHDLWNAIDPLELDERISLVEVPIFFADQDGSALVITDTVFQNDQLTLILTRKKEA